jgi:hypothetical protein
MAERRLSEWKEWPLDLVAILSALQTHQVEYVVIGGFAGLVHGLPLPTYDLDIMLAPGRTNRQRLLTALADLDALALPDEADDVSPSTAEQAVAAELDVSFFTPHGYLDVVSRPAGVRSYGELRRNALTIEVAVGVVARVASVRDLIRSKLAAGRDRDLAKLPALQVLAELS